MQFWTLEFAGWPSWSVSHYPGGQGVVMPMGVAGWRDGFAPVSRPFGGGACGAAQVRKGRTGQGSHPHNRFVLFTYQRAGIVGSVQDAAGGHRKESVGRRSTRCALLD